MKVSKVVLIVIALHVLVIGGIFVFEGCSRAKAPAPDFATNETLPASPANQPALPAEAPAQGLLPTPPTTAAPAPIAPMPATPAAAAPARTYTVKAGDSLWKIAKSHGISVGELATANSLTKTAILKVGQKLTIPAKAETATAPMMANAPVNTAAPSEAAVAGPVVAAAAAPETATYTVKAGDSLWKIAKAQGISVAALKQANALHTDAIKVGQKLVIPARAETAAGVATAAAAASANEWTPGPVQENGQMFHIVDIGESPASIAKKHGIKVEDLMRANNINDARRIRVGDRLTIPVATSTPTPSAAVPSTPAVAAPFVTSMN